MRRLSEIEGVEIIGYADDLFVIIKGRSRRGVAAECTMQPRNSEFNNDDIPAAARSTSPGNSGIEGRKPEDMDQVPSDRDRRSLRIQNLTMMVSQVQVPVRKSTYSARIQGRLK